MLGAGCSVEPPSSVDVAWKCSQRVHDALVRDGVLSPDECSDPTNLSLLSDVVFRKTGTQEPVVRRLLDVYGLRLTPPNQGYLLAAALLVEGAICAIVTLNFDLALVHALAEVGASGRVAVIERPDQMEGQGSSNVYFIHRSANEVDPDAWVLRTSALETEWRGGWQDVISTKVLCTPVVVFAGVGSSVPVLFRSVELIREAIPRGVTIFQVDPGSMSDSAVYTALAITPAEYLPTTWGQFMAEVAARVLEEHLADLALAFETKMARDGLEAETIDAFVVEAKRIGLLNFGRLRARWCFADTPYASARDQDVRLLADLTLGLSLIARVTSLRMKITPESSIQFLHGDRVAATVEVASGGGHMRRAEVEARLSARGREMQLTGRSTVIIAGTADGWVDLSSPPGDVLYGDPPSDDIIAPAAVMLIHLEQIRADHSLVERMVVNG